MEILEQLRSFTDRLREKKNSSDTIVNSENLGSKTAQITTSPAAGAGTTNEDSMTKKLTKENQLAGGDAPVEQQINTFSEPDGDLEETPTEDAIPPVDETTGDTASKVKESLSRLFMELKTGPEGPTVSPEEIANAVVELAKDPDKLTEDITAAGGDSETDEEAPSAAVSGVPEIVPPEMESPEVPPTPEEAATEPQVIEDESPAIEDIIPAALEGESEAPDTDKSDDNEDDSDKDESDKEPKEKKEDSESEDTDEDKDSSDKDSDKEDDKEDDQEGDDTNKDDESSEDKDGETKEASLKAVKMCKDDEAYVVLWGNDNIKEATWVAYTLDRDPIFKVCANDAFPNNMLTATPSASLELPATFATYADYFTDESYGNELLDALANHGVEKTCEAARGTLVKRAQIGVSPISGGPSAGMQELQPAGTTEPAQPLDLPQQSEGGKDTQLNPTDNFNEDDAAKLTVGDFILSMLSPMIATEVYTPQEAMSELRNIFSDETAASAFEGALVERADHLTGDKSGTSEATKETSPEAAAQVSAPEDAPADANSAGSSPQKMAALVAENDRLRKEATLRIKVSMIQDFIHTELQRRGPNNTPLVPSVAYLEATGVPHEAAVEQEREAVLDKTRELVKLNETSWDVYMKTVLTHPVISPSFYDGETATAGQKKTASLSNSLAIFLANDNASRDASNPFSEELFKTKLTDLAFTKNSERKNQNSRNPF